jgi:hypothetical protein
MRKLLPALALTSLLGFTACTDQYGRFDPVATGLLAAGGAIAAVGIGAAISQPSQGYDRRGYNRRQDYRYSQYQPRRGGW